MFIPTQWSLLIAGAALCLGAFAAQAAPTLEFKRVTLADLARDPKAFVNQPIELHEIDCLPNDAGYTCITGLPLQIVIDTAPPRAPQYFVNAECGQPPLRPEAETDCFVELRFVPTELTVVDATYPVSGGGEASGTVTTLKATTAIFIRGW